MTIETFGDALEYLNITDFQERIFNSNSHGELFHLLDYISIARWMRENELDTFREWFLKVVDFAEKNWKRPESIFQYIGKYFEESVKHDLDMQRKTQ